MNMNTHNQSFLLLFPPIILDLIERFPMFKLKGKKVGMKEGRKTMKAVQSNLFLSFFFIFYKCSYSKINLYHSFKFKNPRPRK